MEKRWIHDTYKLMWDGREEESRQLEINWKLKGLVLELFIEEINTWQ